MDRDAAHFLVKNFGHLMTDTERLAFSRLAWTIKQARGISDATSQAEVFAYRPPPADAGERLNDPEVLRLTADGYEPFVMRTGDRILRDHAGEVFLNRCPKCGELAATPLVRQCPNCHHAWHHLSERGEPPSDPG
jgi:hypothetical protein